MANRNKGEVSFGHEGQTYTLVLSTNALVQLQEMFSDTDEIAGIESIVAKIQKGSTKHLRAYLWAAMQRHHKDKAPTPEAAADFLDDCGDVAAPAILSLFGLSMPDPKDLAELQKANPPTAQAKKTRKRGVISTSTAASAA